MERASESMSFGVRLRRARQAAGLTQAELAERAGLSVKAVSALERGSRQRPYPATVRALADALGLSEHERAELAGSTPQRGGAAGTANTPQTLLPEAPTPLIGRERELADVGDLLRSGAARMVTLTGPGGVGKTRLALEVASVVADSVGGRVGYVSLGPLADPALVLPTVAQALGLTESGDIPVQALIAKHLGKQTWLLVLDNLEHLLGAAPELAELLAMAPRLTMLVTSRAPLRIRAEHEFPVRPLALPDLTTIPSIADVAAASSVQLFLARARSAVPGFELTPANYMAIATICRRLDGLPLALELVAARTRVLSPTELLARIEHVLPLLVAGPRDLPQRQQTMRAAINWSYELLGPREQALFRRLSVFAGGWALEAAEDVVAWGEVSSEEVIDLLSALVEQALVVADANSGEATRFRMLEPIRQFAAQCADESNETATLFERHAAWCLALAQQAAGEMLGPEQQRWLTRLEQEHDNMRRALAWAEQDRARSQLGLQLAAALWRLWETRGYLTEGRRWLDQALAAGEDAPAGLRAGALNAAGNLARDQGDQSRAVELLEASLTLCRELGDAEGMAKALNDLGNVATEQGAYGRAGALYAEALALFRGIDADYGIAIAVGNLGLVVGYQGDYTRAVASLEEAIARWKQLGETALRARAVDALGVVVGWQGDLKRAEALYLESLALCRELGDTRGISFALSHLGQLAQRRGDYPEATRLLEEALRLRRSIGTQSGIAISLSLLGNLARHLGDVGRALALYREALSMQHRMGLSQRMADCLLGLAAVANARGDPARAARLLGASDAVRETLSQVMPPFEQADYEQIAAAIRGELGPEQFARAGADGRRMPRDQAIAFALEDR